VCFVRGCSLTLTLVLESGTIRLTMSLLQLCFEGPRRISLYSNYYLINFMLYGGGNFGSKVTWPGQVTSGRPIAYILPLCNV
jgi:hypothetical protein